MTRSCVWAGRCSFPITLVWILLIGLVMQFPLVDPRMHSHLNLWFH